jgi:hypothetical protein
MGPYEKEDLIPRIQAESENVKNTPRFFQRCAIKYCNAPLSAMKFLTPTSKSSYELVVNNKINYNTRNVKLINVY